MSLILFDVNETLLDLSTMRQRFADYLDDASLTGRWFDQLLKHSFVATITDHYRDFAALGADALDIVAAGAGHTLTPAARQAILDGMTQLPAHPDVPAALDRLRAAGYTLATITNSPPDALAAKMAYAGLTDRFERLLSVDAVRRFKPSPEVYAYALAEMDATAADTWFVASHDWDIAGAVAAGLKGAFLARPGRGLGRALPQPHLVVPDLGAFADRLLGAAP